MFVSIQLKYDEFEPGLDESERLRRASRANLRLLTDFLNKKYPNLVTRPSNLFASFTLYNIDEYDTNKLVDDIRTLSYVENVELLDV